MKQKRSFWISTVAPLLILGVGIYGASLLVRHRPKPEQKTFERPIMAVRVLPVQLGSEQLYVDTQGTLAPLHSVALSAEIAGRVLEVSPRFRAGHHFNKGDILLQIDPTDYHLAQARANTAIAEAKLRLQEEQARFHQAQSDLKRLGLQGSSEPLARRELQLKLAKTQLKQAEALLLQAERDLKRSTVRAPSAGRLTQVLADPGEFLNRAQVLAHFYPEQTLQVRLSLSAEQLSRLGLTWNFKGDRPIKVILKAPRLGPQASWEARLTRIEAEFDPATRLIHAYAELPANAEAPPPGIFLEARIFGRTIPNAFRVPRSAFNLEGVLWVLDAESKLQPIRPEILQLGRHEAILKSDALGASAVFVTSPLKAPSAGVQVRVIDPAKEKTKSDKDKSNSDKNKQP